MKNLQSQCCYYFRQVCFFRLLYISTVHQCWQKGINQPDVALYLPTAVTSLAIPIENLRRVATQTLFKEHAQSQLPSSKGTIQRGQKKSSCHDIIQNNPHSFQLSSTVSSRTHRVESIDDSSDYRENEGKEIKEEEEGLQQQQQQPFSILNPNSSILLTIPIFPLRKTVKIPTDNITLNLYESRYVRMVEEAILNPSTVSSSSDDHGKNNDHHLPLFGAIYTTNLPHMVVPPTVTISSKIDHNDNNYNTSSSKNTYIVPILEPNMIGSLFIVTNHTTLRKLPDGDKVIQLNATAILRFQIIKIINTGGYDNLLYINSNNNACQPETDNKPFIVAQVQLLLSRRNTTDTTRTSRDDLQPTSRVDNTCTNLQKEILALPNYLQEILSEYGTTILSAYFDDRSATTSTTLPLMEKTWKNELVRFYEITSSSSRDDSVVVPSYSEQKQRLQQLIE